MTPPLAFGLPTNGLEWMLVSMVVLLLFGAKRLPELAKGLGRSLQEFKRAREDFESELHRSQHEPQVSQPTDRQLHYRPATPESAATAGSASSALEQQVRELQQQLREMQERQNPDLPPPVAPTVPREQVVVESRPGVSGPAAVPTPVVPPTHSHP